MAGAYVDPTRQHLVDRHAELRLGALTEGASVLRALASARPVVVPGDATASISQVLEASEAVDVLDELAPAHAVVFPLRARGRTLGLITLPSGAERGAMQTQDLDTALDVAGRAGLALDNARLYRQQRDLASGLQRSLLTTPPEPDHTHVVVRYSPAVEAAQVGGVTRTLGVATTVTAVVARLEQTDDDRARGATVLQRMLPEHAEDDVALVAVRLYPQDRPRPPEAGPRRLPQDADDAPEVLGRP